MPTWGEIQRELEEEYTKTGNVPFDSVRRKYLSKLSSYSGRNCILYATDWTNVRNDPYLITITDEDIQGLMEVIHGLHGNKLDLILHSPGGSPESAASIVSYLRSKFDDIRVIIPHAAMSAATMISCASDQIVMGKHSFIGPIDPQFILQTPLGVRSVPAQAILDQFEMAKKQCEDPQTMGAWLPILNQYGPALLVQSENAIALSKKYVSAWLAKYMFADDQNNGVNEKAELIAEHLSDHTQFKSHSHHIDREEAQRIGLCVDCLETNQIFQDLVLSLYHATTHTFSGTPAVKIIENQYGKAFIRSSQPPVAPPQDPSE